MQAYRARYELGRFVPLTALEIPEGSQAIVTVLDDAEDDVCQRQRAALVRFREEMRNCDEPVPAFERIEFREVEV